MSNSPVKTVWQHLNTSTLLRFLLLFACGWALVQLIHYFYSVIVIFTIAATLAALLNYPVHWLARYIPRGLAIAIVFLTFLGLLIALITVLGFEVMTQGQGLASSLFNFLNTTDFKPVQKFLDTIDLAKVIQTLQSGLLSGLGLAQSIFSNVLIGIFIAVICIYMLIDGNRIWTACLSLLPDRIRDRFATRLQTSFLGFFRAQFLLVLFLSTSSFIIFSILGVKYALFLCIILGVIDAIPGIGGTLCAIVVTTLVFLSQGFWMAGQVFIACTVLEQIQDNLISPKLMKDTLNINPVLLFFALFIGERIAGLLGVFLSIPIAAMLVGWFAHPNHSPELDLEEAQQDSKHQD
jgi:predicted PurR-regulated permease PerM